MPPPPPPRLSTDTAAARSLAEGATEGDEEANVDFDDVDVDEERASSSARASTAASMALGDGADDASMVLGCVRAISRAARSNKKRKRETTRERERGGASLFSLSFFLKKTRKKSGKNALFLPHSCFFFRPSSFFCI